MQKLRYTGGFELPFLLMTDAHNLKRILKVKMKWDLQTLFTVMDFQINNVGLD